MVNGHLESVINNDDHKPIFEQFQTLYSPGKNYKVVPLTIIESGEISL